MKNYIQDYEIIKEKIDLLGLNEERQTELQQLFLEEFPLDGCKYEPSYSKEVINVDNIVGVCRPMYANTWLEMLSNKYCHKMKNFDLYNYTTFVQLLLKEPPDGLPIVYEYNNKYYIAGNGLHRLTIAKCIGNMKALVYVGKFDS